MDDRYDKALILYRQERYELAERELHQLLAGDPSNAWAHAMLGLCLTARGKLDAADSAVRAAIKADPDADFPHYAHAVLLVSRQHPREAHAAILEAVRRNPYDAENRGLLAAIELDLGRPSEALREADATLEIDPGHTTSLNVRAKALIALGRAVEARHTLERSLEVDPSNGDTHEAMGSAMLHLGDSEAALARYREALRLNPNSASARDGFLQGLKSRHRVYRWFLMFFLWMGRQRVAVRVGVILALVGGRRILQTVSEQAPEWAPVAIPLAVLLALFLLGTWAADPLFNLLIRFDPVGRHALTARQRAGSNYLVVLVLLVAGVATALSVAPRSDTVGAFAIASLILLPVTLLLSYPPGSRQRRQLGALTCVVAVIGVAAVTVYAAGDRSPSARTATVILGVVSAILSVASITLGSPAGAADDARGTV